MKRKLLTLVAAMSVAGIVFAADEPAKTEETKSGPAPKIKLDQLVYDFGTTSMVQQLAGKFIVSNTGDAPLELKKPVPTCGCTVPALKTDKLAPGESTELNFTLNIGSPRGHVEKSITLNSNDPAQPSVRLTLKADMVPTFEFTPQVVTFGDLRQGVITNATVLIRRLDGKPLGVDRAETTQTFIHTKLTPVEDTTDSMQLTVELEAEGSQRQLNDTVKIFAGDATQPAFVIPVTARVVGDVTASPEAQFWGIADPENWPGNRPEQQQRKFQIVLTRPDGKLEIKKATSDLSDVTVDVRPVEEGKSYEVVATLAKAPKQSEHGTIKVETNLASLELGLTVNVLKRN